MPIGPLDWDIHYLKVFWGISGEKWGARLPELLKNCFFGAKLMKFAQIKPNNPPKKPNNECPNQMAQLAPFRMLWANKKAHNRPFNGANYLQ